MATAYAGARANYQFAKKYAEDSEAKQVGAPIEKKKVDGAFVKQEVALDPDEQAAIEKEIEDQRKAE